MTSTILLIHGLIGSLDYFDPARRVRNAEVKTVDLLGYGRYRNVNTSGLSLGDQASHVSEFIDDLECDCLWLLGHSMGGAIALMAATESSRRIDGVINVEGNFSLKDAFWSSGIAASLMADWVVEFDARRRDPARWLERTGVTPSGQRSAWAAEILNHQPASTVHAMSVAIVAGTAGAEGDQWCHQLAGRGTAIHLIAGARSAAHWDVPPAVRSSASSYHEIPETGHMMMLEEPDLFCGAIDTILAW